MFRKGRSAHSGPPTAIIPNDATAIDSPQCNAPLRGAVWYVH